MDTEEEATEDYMEYYEDDSAASTADMAAHTTRKRPIAAQNITGAPK
jgi:hypothetical protein